MEKNMENPTTGKTTTEEASKLLFDSLKRGNQK